MPRLRRGSACVRGVLEREEGVNGRPGPGLVQGGAGLGDGGQLAQQVRAAQGVPRDAGEAAGGLLRVVDRDPAKAGSIPAASMPSFPRFGWTVTSTHLPEDAECTQKSFPAVRNPDSSKCATSVLTSAAVTALTARATSRAAFRAAEASAPGDGAQPDSSPRAWQARSRDRNWPCHR